MRMSQTRSLADLDSGAGMQESGGIGNGPTTTIDFGQAAQEALAYMLRCHECSILLSSVFLLLTFIGLGLSKAPLLPLPLHSPCFRRAVHTTDIVASQPNAGATTICVATNRPCRLHSAASASDTCSTGSLSAVSIASLVASTPGGGASPNGASSIGLVSFHSTVCAPVTYSNGPSRSFPFDDLPHVGASISHHRESHSVQSSISLDCLHSLDTLASTLKIPFDSLPSASTLAMLDPFNPSWSAEYGSSKSGCPELHYMLAEYIYSESPELDMAKVTVHFVRGNNPEKFASTLANFMGKQIHRGIYGVILFLYQIFSFFLNHLLLPFFIGGLVVVLLSFLLSREEGSIFLWPLKTSLFSPLSTKEKISTSFIALFTLSVIGEKRLGALEARPNCVPAEPGKMNCALHALWIGRGAVMDQGEKRLGALEARPNCVPAEPGKMNSALHALWIGRGTVMGQTISPSRRQERAPEKDPEEGCCLLVHSDRWVPARGQLRRSSASLPLDVAGR
ncbi:hypothetical protein KSP40_PGU019049 [Platanthera guangdongensis]|uniref:Uncharacterized protein n=1 Tax=Platanthera guangdongensis TaxID=2320717 RepID=A0ABR2N1V2_9ASPA